MMRIKFQQLFHLHFLLIHKSCKAEEFAYPTLIVKNIKQKKSQESEDELYFTIYEQLEPHRETNSLSEQTNTHSQLIRQPDFPLYFSSNRLSHLTNYPIWRGFLRKGDKINLQLTLMEQDFPPWNPDDYISTVEIDIYFSGSDIRAKWQVLGQNRMSFSTQGNHQTKLVPMTSENAEYKVEFILVNGKFDLDNKSPLLSIGYPLYPFQSYTPYMLDSLE